MIYSCFDQETGLYRYFEDASTKPVNGDLPVPSWLKQRSTKLGVPSLEAGRPLPSEAKPIGRGHQARGMVVQCKGGTALSAGSLPLDTGQYLIAGTALGVAALLWWTDQKVSSVTIGAVGVYSLFA